MSLPNHIAIIMDGNGRWGLKNYGNRLTGHQYGVKNTKAIISFCIKKKINNLTLFALSSDNLAKRNKKEIFNLFDLMSKFLEDNKNYFIDNKIQINFIGKNNNLPTSIKKIKTKFNNITYSKQKKILINIAFNYSSKDEILNSIRTIVKKKKKINKKNIENFLYLKTIQHPDILIRTGGYKRLSDFFLWQCAYTELFFLNKLWPDFKVFDLKKILQKFITIKRNFGK